jgi:RNA polymerase sigma factor (sigma-70 family)
MSTFDPNKPRQTLSTKSGVKVVVRDLPPPEPEWEPEPVAPRPGAVIVPENQPVGDRNKFVRWLDKKWGRFMRNELRGISERSREDVLQHVRFIAVTEYDNTGPLEHPGAFVGRVIDNALRNRHGKLELPIDDRADPDDKIASSPNPESAAARAEKWERVERYVAALPKPLRQVFEGRERDGDEFAELAKRLGRPLSTVQSQHRRALEMLRDLARASDRAPG